MPRIRLLFSFVVTAALLAVSQGAQAATSSLVVSQIYAGGGNTGAAYANDFVELFNRGSSSVDLSGWTLQYASAASSSWSTVALSGSIDAGRYYLVQLASAGSIGSALPTPDASGSTNIALSGGKIALVHGATALSCGASAGSCASSSGLEDFVGYGSASDYEGAGAAAALTSTTSAFRADGGCTDTDSNSGDFATDAPAPRSSASSSHACGSSPPPPAGVSQGASVDVDVQPLLSIALERSAISFGSAAAGDTPAPVSESVTVVSNNAAGYALSIHRTGFSPADLPLGIGATAPAGGTLGSAFGSGLVGIPIAPAADLAIGSTSARSASGGDVWPTRIGFTGPLPTVPSGHYTATVTYTVIGR